MNKKETLKREILPDLAALRKVREHERFSRNAPEKERGRKGGIKEKEAVRQTFLT